MKRSILILTLIGLLVLVAVVSSQETPIPTIVPTAQGTPLSPGTNPAANVTPQDLPSLSGVGGTPLLSSVRIRAEPSTSARQIGIVRFGRFVDIVGTNGFDTDRSCTPDFAADLDMWVQVVFREQRGWVARCTLTIYGDLSRLPIEAEPPAVG